jgi:transposase
MPGRKTAPMDQRTQFIADHLRETQTITELCDRYGVSRKTGDKWIDRYLRLGPAGLEEHSRRPHRAPNQTADEIVAAILEARQRNPGWGGKKLRVLLQRRHPRWTLPGRGPESTVRSPRSTVSRGMMPGMAPETEVAPEAPAIARPKIRLRRTRRPDQKPPENGIRPGDSARASELGKLGGRPLSIRRAFPEVYGLAKRVWTDPVVQSTVLDLAQAGLLHPMLMRELLYVYNGRPAYKMQIPREVDPDEDEKRERMRAMPRAERRLLMDLLRKVNRPALPAAAATCANSP